MTSIKMNIRYILFDWGGTLGKSGYRKYFINSPQLSAKCNALQPNVVGLLKYLCSKNIGMSVLSNTKYTYNQMLRNLRHTGLDKYFDFYLYSSDKNLCKKPCEKIFTTALSNIRKIHPDIKQNQILYVGNNYLKDVFGPMPFMKTAFVTNGNPKQKSLAQTFGMHNILLDNVVDLERFI